MYPDWNRLRIFKEVYARKSISRAAEKLHVTASAISQQLKILEYELGFQLFSRNQRILVPTTDAEKMYDLIDGFSHGLERGMATLSAKRNKVSGTIRMGAPVAFGTGLLAMTAFEFRRLNPAVRFVIRTETGTKPLNDGILNNKLDMAFADAPPSGTRKSSFSVTPVIEEQNVLVCSKGYFSNHLEQGTSVERLLGCDFVSDNTDAPEIRCLFKGRMSKRSEMISVPIIAGNIHGVVNLALQGAGVAVLPEHTIVRYLDSGKLVKIPGYDKALVNQIVLLQLKERIPTPAEKEFIRYLLQRGKRNKPT